MPSPPNPKHQQDSIEWAKAVLDQPKRYVILDTETTGVGADDEVIQIGIIDPRGSVFLDRLIKPAQGKPWTRKLWVYDLRTNMRFTQKTNPLQHSDLDEFVACYKPGQTARRKETWSENNPKGHWRCYDYEDLIKRDKVSIDIFWLKDKSLEDSDDLPPPDEPAREIAEDLQTAWEQFASIAAKVKG